MNQNGLLCRNTGTYSEVRAGGQLLSRGDGPFDFGAGDPRAAWAMCQNLPTKLIVSTTNTKVKMARSELCHNLMISAHTIYVQRLMWCEILEAI
jgi:hypothetical protein